MTSVTMQQAEMYLNILKINMFQTLHKKKYQMN